MGCGNSSVANSVNEASRVSQFKPVPMVAPDSPLLSQSEKSNPLMNQTSVFSETEMVSLRRRFLSLAKVEKDDGLIDQNEFLAILKFEKSLFTDRMFKMFDLDRNGTITMDEFMEALAVMHKNGPLKEKIKLSFRFWDLDDDGTISKNEIKELMKASLEASNLLVSESQMNLLIDATFALADCDSNGQITVTEYEKLVELFPNIISNMTLDIADKLDGMKKTTT